MIKKILKYALIAAIWLSLWQLIAMIVDKELLFPAPLSVLSRLCELALTAGFYKTIFTSLLRVLLGMLAGIAVGVAGGVLSSLLRFAHDLFSPMLAIIKSTPVASFIILLVLWLSRDATPVVISAIMVLPVVWANVETGLLTTDRSLLEMADAYRLSTAKRISNIYIPSTYPYFLSAMRSSLGMAWKAGIAAEVLLQPLTSVGKQIFESKYMLETRDLFAWTLVVIVLSVLIEQLMMLVFARAARRYSFKTGGAAYG